MCSDRFDLCALTPVERARNDLSFTSSRERETDRDRDRQTGRERETQRDIERETHRET